MARKFSRSPKLLSCCCWRCSWRYRSWALAIAVSIKVLRFRSIFPAHGVSLTVCSFNLFFFPPTLLLHAEIRDSFILVSMGREIEKFRVGEFAFRHRPEQAASAVAAALTSTVAVEGEKFVWRTINVQWFLDFCEHSHNVRICYVSLRAQWIHRQAFEWTLQTSSAIKSNKKRLNGGGKYTMKKAEFTSAEFSLLSCWFSAFPTSGLKSFTAAFDDSSCFVFDTGLCKHPLFGILNFREKRK